MRAVFRLCLPAILLLAFATTLAAQPGSAGLEHGINRIGEDLRDLALPRGGPAACHAACAADGACRAFTFVPEGDAGAGTCWLKADIAPPQREAGMVSGIVRRSPGGAALRLANTPEANAAARALVLALRPGWQLQRERVVDGPEGRLVVRVGDIDNLGFGWAEGYDPFSGRATEAHGWPWAPDADDAPGTDRIMVGSGVAYPLLADARDGDGYHGVTDRPGNAPQAISFEPGALPAGFRRVFLQLFVDDFQAPRMQTAFVVTLNGHRVPAMETAVNALDQTGPVGKLLTLALPAELHGLLSAPRIELLIDDPSTGARDGYAIDFARLLVDPRIANPATLRVTVVEKDTERPIAGASLSVLDLGARTNPQGEAILRELPGGLLVVGAAAPGFEDGTGVAELVVGETGALRIELSRRAAPPARQALQEALRRDGRVVLRGIRFDTDNAVPRADSLAELEALLALIRETRAPGWMIEGHTDSTGGAAHNRSLSAARAKAVVEWLAARGVDRTRLRSEGYGPDRPVGDNGTAAGRALNRRVEAAPLR
jgi:outer membrane protein OmpA-like peptidoglycan-associated protein